MIVTTKTGDQGTTEIQSGRISKADPLLEVLGDLDELSADCLVFASLTPAYRLVMEALVQDLSRLRGTGRVWRRPVLPTH